MREPDEFAELRAIVHRAGLGAEDPVEHFRDWKRERERDHHHDPHDPEGVAADREAVPRAHSLRRDLAEDDDGESGGEGDEDAGADDLVEEQRERRVHEYVAQEDRAQQKVAALPKRLDHARVALLGLRAALDEDLELSHVERHESEIEAREDGRHGEEEHHEHDLQPQWQKRPSIVHVKS